MISGIPKNEKIDLYFYAKNDKILTNFITGFRVVTHGSFYLRDCIACGVCQPECPVGPFLKVISTYRSDLCRAELAQCLSCRCSPA